MLRGNNQENGQGHVYKCSGIPLYPAKHPIIDKRLERIPKNQIKNREKKVIRFLNRYGFDLNENE